MWYLKTSTSISTQEKSMKKEITLSVLFFIRNFFILSWSGLSLTKSDFHIEPSSKHVMLVDWKAIVWLRWGGSRNEWPQNLWEKVARAVKGRVVLSVWWLAVYCRPRFPGMRQCKHNAISLWEETVYIVKITVGFPRMSNNKEIIPHVILTQDMPPGNYSHNQGRLTFHKSEN